MAIQHLLSHQGLGCWTRCEAYHAIDEDTGQQEAGGYREYGPINALGARLTSHGRANAFLEVLRRSVIERTGAEGGSERLLVLDRACARLTGFYMFFDFEAPDQVELTIHIGTQKSLRFFAVHAAPP
jgi:hypothetical protein